MSKKIPFPHQEKGAKYLADRESAFLFFKMRMGKTFTCIMAMKQLKEFPVLIVCPKIVMQTWYDELIEEGAKKSSIVKVDSASKKKNLELLNSGKHITIVNFEKVKNYDILKARRWRIVIVDELDRLANISSQVTRYFMRNRKPEYQRRWGLSGTPAPETAVNLVTEYMIILGEFMGYRMYNKYMLENWDKHPFTGKWVPVDEHHPSKILTYVKNTACLATMSDLGLGAKFTFGHRYVPMNATQKQLFIKAEREYKANKIHGGGVDDTIDPAKLVYRLRRKMISAGIDPYDGHKIISQNKHKDAVEYWKWYQEPLLVTSAFREPIADVADLFRKAGAKVAVIHGGVSDEKRNILRKDFMAGKYDIVVAQTKTIKMGLNFSRANTILVLSNTDSGSDREQLVDRIQHMEATEVKSIIDIHSQGSIDEKVLEGLGAKEKESISYFK